MAWTPRAVFVAAALVVLLLVAWLGASTTVGAAAARARQAGTMRCNGHAALCDRRLDQVAFAGAHNAMSAATDPGWLFAEQLTGIPAQLDEGVRALLIKTHYGIPTGIQVGGTELVVTDKAAEIGLRPQRRGRRARARSGGPGPPAGGDGPRHRRRPTTSTSATSTAPSAPPGSATPSASSRHFLDRNPHDVVMVFIGDYVSPADTAKVFDEAGLTNRLWTYDTDAPPPTLRQMIDARRTLLVLSEHAGPPPSWYTKGYGIFQDTPFTFARPSEFSCAPNRGPADAPLFEINHFITNTQPPSAEEAEQVNSDGVALGAVAHVPARAGAVPHDRGRRLRQRGRPHGRRRRDQRGLSRPARLRAGACPPLVVASAQQGPPQRGAHAHQRAHHRDDDDPGGHAPAFALGEALTHPLEPAPGEGHVRAP